MRPELPAIAIFIAEGPREEARPYDHIPPLRIRELEEMAADPPALQAAQMVADVEVPAAICTVPAAQLPCGTQLDWLSPLEN